MSGDPCLKFLGVPESSDPRDLLGMPLGNITAAAVEAALLERIDLVYRHTDARAGETPHVRRVLRDAAKSLLDGLRQPPSPARAAGHDPGVKLTEFDRRVLAVLIGSGGWNAQCRTRLVSLAADYSVSVQGLLKVMTGLSEYARRGGPRLGIGEITAGLTRPDPAPGAAAGDTRGPDDEWINRFAPEFRDRSPAATLKLAMLFGLLTIFCGLIAWRVLFAPLPAPPAAPAVTPPERRAESPATPPAPARGPRDAPGPRLATYAGPPTFQGQALTADAAAAADDCPQLVGELETIGRKLSIAGIPSDAVYRGWDVSLATAATGWVLVDERLLEHIGEAVLEGLYAASDSPSVTDRLLLSLTPPAGRLDETVDVWRGAWNSGMLAQVASSRGLPPAVVQRARIQLELALGGPVPPGGEPFRAGAAAWLDRIAATLVDGMEFNRQTYDYWEFWIAAQRRLGRGDRFDGAMMSAIELILATSTDLAREGPSVNVLGRLVSLADFHSSAVVRERFLALFGEEAGVDSRDLWVITSLLAQSETTAWFGPDLVIADDADWMFRRRIADRIGDRWPEAATVARAQVARLRGIAVDPDLAARWLALFEQMDAEPPAATDGARATQLLAASRLNEIAVRLVVGDADEAARQLDLLEGGAPASPPKANPPSTSFRPAPPPGTGAGGRAGAAGRGSGRDGEFAVAYEDAGRRVDERLQLLGSLRDRTAGDLGPVDAEVFVRAVYRDIPAEVRTLAREILVEQFTSGATVALEMLDQFADVPATRANADLVREFTGWRLPALRSESWHVDARLAMVHHALDLVAPAGEIDELMDAVLASYDSRRSCLDPYWSPSQSVSLAAAELAETWRKRAASFSSQAGHPVPGDEAEIQRRHTTRLRLAQGPLQRFVASQLAMLDQMAYMAVADQAALREPALGVLLDSARRRSRMSHVLSQAVETERAMGRLWSLQIAIREQEDRT